MRRWWLWLALLVILSGLYGVAVARQWALNEDMRKVDQSAYMDYARGVATIPGFMGDRNRMPNYPTLQALHYRADEDPQAFFERGKALNVALSVLLLGIVAALFARALPRHFALMGVIMTAFTVFAFRAPYFQAELLFYGLFFACFLLSLRMLTHPTWIIAVGLGFLAAMTHLTKASILIMLVLMSGVYAAQTLWQVWESVRGKSSEPLPQPFPLKGAGQKTDDSPALFKGRGQGGGVFRPAHLRDWVQRAGYLVLVWLVFLGTLWPYLSNSQRVFGSHFYNVNTTFYIWYDSWDEVVAGTRAAGDRTGYPDLPPEQIPSFQKYIREHTIQDMVSRLTDGLVQMFRRHYGEGYGYATYLTLYGVVLAMLAGMYRERVGAFLRRDIWRALFVAGVLSAYTLSYAWYTPIAGGNRFMLSLWLPALFCSLWVFAQLDKNARPGWLGWFHRGVAMLLAFDILWIVAYRAGEVYAAW